MTNQPSVGRIVHYVSYGTPGGEYTPQCRAAIITEIVNDGLVGLAVLNPTGLFFNRSQYDDLEGAAPQGDSWHWPERTGS
jgi:hypothetical protein